LIGGEHGRQKVHLDRRSARERLSTRLPCKFIGAG
jgi:hypothetical protein